MAKISYKEARELKIKAQELCDRITECNEMLAEFDGMPKATVTADDIEASSITYYCLPMPYILKAVREWREHTSLELEAIYQKLED